MYDRSCYSLACHVLLGFINMVKTFTLAPEKLGF
jgi:hypothetical protein